MKRIGFVQPFGVDAPGGGSRILRSLLKHSPLEVVSIVSSPRKPADADSVTEIHLPYRPYFHWVEHTRFSRFFDSANAPLLPHYVSRLTALCKTLELSGIHSIAHWWDSPAAFEAAKRLRIPFFLTVHDDVRYTAMGDARLERRLAPLWQEAAVRYSISQELGEEYNHRYGRRSFTVVTDGLTSCQESPRPPAQGKLRVYFMGLFHLAYLENFHALFSALRSLATGKTAVTLRCGITPHLLIPEDLPVKILPFTVSEETLAGDIEDSDLLYLPLPFEEQYASFSNFSLSTKLVTYLGSGVPILYHGPSSSAAARLLARYNAATLVTKPGRDALLQALAQQQPQSNQATAANALSLARSQFQLSEIAKRFWTHILGGPPE